MVKYNPTHAFAFTVKMLPWIELDQSKVMSKGRETSFNWIVLGCSIWFDKSMRINVDQELTKQKTQATG